MAKIPEMPGGLLVLIAVLCSVPLTAQTTNSVGMMMIRVDGGSFLMGTDKGERFDGPPHPVAVSSFSMSDTEVTQVQYRAVMGGDPGQSGNRKDLPQGTVSWYGAVEFCNRLSGMEGLRSVYAIDKSRRDPDNHGETDGLRWTVTADWAADGYRLPTEAEWEFAARGGNLGKGARSAGGDDINEVGWHILNSGFQSAAVRGKKPNELGLYDMSGNLWEWVWDWWSEYPLADAKESADPRGPAAGMYRVQRGGAYQSSEKMLAVTYRMNGYECADGGPFIGFRVVKR